MPDYRYVAIDPQGRERKGRLTAANDDAARADLVRRKFHIVAVEAAGAKPASRSLLAFRRARLSSKELALFTRQLPAALSRHGRGGRNDGQPHHDPRAPRRPA